jgi:hypothetical protein
VTVAPDRMAVTMEVSQVTKEAAMMAVVMTEVTRELMAVMMEGTKVEMMAVPMEETTVAALEEMMVATVEMTAVMATHLPLWMARDLLHLRQVIS